MLCIQPGLHGSNDLHIGQKMATFYFFLVPETGGSAMGPDPEIRLGD